MKIQLFDGEKFETKEFIQVFEFDWVDEEFEGFLEKNGFTKYPETFAGFIHIFYSSADKDRYFVQVDNISGELEEFLIKGFINLVKFLHFFGANYFEEMKQQNLHTRILPLYDLSYSSLGTNFLDIKRIGEDEVFVKSYNQINTHEEDRKEALYRKQKRLEREKKRQEKNREKTV